MSSLCLITRVLGADLPAATGQEEEEADDGSQRRRTDQEDETA